MPTPEELDSIYKKYGVGKYYSSPAAPSVPAKPATAPAEQDPGLAGTLGHAIGWTAKTVVGAPPVQASLGFGEAIYGAGKGLVQLTSALATHPVETVKAISSHVQDLISKDPSPAVKTSLQSLHNDFVSNPSRATGKLLGEGVMLLAPSSLLRLGRALPTIGRGADVVAPVAEEAASVAKASAPAVVASAVADAQRTAGAGGKLSAAARFKQTVERATSDRPLGTSDMVSVGPSGEPVVTKLPVRAARVAPEAQLSPSIAPAPEAVRPTMTKPLTRVSAPALEKPLDPAFSKSEAVPPSPAAVQPTSPVAQGAPGPLQAAPLEPGAAAPVAPKMLIPRPTRAMPVKPGDEAAAEAAAMAEKQAAVQKLQQQLAARAAARRAAAPVEAVPEAPMFPTRPAAPAVTPGAVTSVPGAGVRLQPIESSAFDAYGYSPHTMEFAVRPKGGAGTYLYSNVPQEVADQVIKAPSFGTAFNKLIKSNPAYQLGGTGLEFKKLSNTVESLLANGAAEADVAKGIAKKAAALGMKPKDVIAQVRDVRGIPTDPEEVFAWSRDFKAAQKARIAQAVATEIAPVDASALRKAVAEPSMAGEKLSAGMHVETPKEFEIQSSPVEDGFKAIQGGQEMLRTGRGFTKNLPEMADRILPQTGLGQQVIRATTLYDGAINRITKALGSVRFDKMTAAEEASLKSAIDGEAIKLTPRAQAVLDQMTSTATMRGTTVAEDLESLFGADQVVARPMKEMAASYLSKATLESSIEQSLGDVGAVRQMIQESGHLDAPLLLHAFDQWRGAGFMDPLTRQLRNTAANLNLVADATAIKFTTTIKHIGQTAMGMAKVPIIDAFRSIPLAMKRGWQGVDVAGETISSMNQIMGQEIRSVAEVGAMGTASDFAMKGSRLILKSTGIGRMVNLVKTWVYTAKEMELTRLVKAFQSGNEAAGRRLVRNGFDLHADVLADEVKYVAKEYTDRMTFRPDIVHMPVAFSSPMMQIARGLQTYSINVTKALYKEFVYPTLHPGKFGGMLSEGYLEQLAADAKLGGYGYAAGTVVAEAEALLKQRVRPKDQAMRVAEALAYVGALGMFRNMINGLTDKDGNTVAPEKILPVLQRNLGQQLIGSTSGAAPGIIGGIVQKGPRWSNVPLVGDIVQGEVNKNK